VGGIPELLPPEDTVPPGDRAALARKIREVVTDPARLARMSARNLAKAREYQADRLRDRQTAFYRYLRERTEEWLEGRNGKALMTATGLKRHLLKWGERVACALAHQVLCVSHSVREVAIAERLCPPDKIKVLRGGSVNGVDAAHAFNPARLPAAVALDARARHGIPADALVAGFVGRVVRDKGLTELARAWQGLREEFPALHLLIVGPFEPQDPLPAEVEAVLRGDPRIHLTGEVWDVPPLYAAMDLVVLPRYREGFGIVAIEAAALGLPAAAVGLRSRLRGGGGAQAVAAALPGRDDVPRL
jgi:glycosyltransferase involved in cell wall biosynthesis